MIWMPALGSAPPVTAASVRVVTARRRSPVALTLHARNAGPGGNSRTVGVEISAGTRTLARYRMDHESAVALSCLLDGPVWLLMVAADVPGCVFARLWALVPATAELPLELGDNDAAYALPLTEFLVADQSRVHPGDLMAEVAHLLHHLSPGRSAAP